MEDSEVSQTERLGSPVGGIVGTDPRPASARLGGRLPMPAPKYLPITTLNAGEAGWSVNRIEHRVGCRHVGELI